MDNISKSRERAEAAFGKVQSEFTSRSRVLDEHDAVVQARDEKTARLRELRLAKEASTPAVVKPAKRVRAVK